MIRQRITSASNSNAVEQPSSSAGFVKFYGLYWSADYIELDHDRLLGQPIGWLSKGKISKSYDRSQLQMNFWGQKGVYVLYDYNLHPVYAGQVGLTKKGVGRSLGQRLKEHRRGIYRNAWTMFSWFGFLDTDKIDPKNASEVSRMEPTWRFSETNKVPINGLLSSFEAVLIEAFAPRFNARGGDLKGAVRVDQFEWE